MKFDKIENLNHYHLFYDDENKKNEYVENEIINKFKDNQYDLNDIIIDLFYKNDVDVEFIDDNKLLIYYVDDEYVLIDILENINIDKYKIHVADDDDHEFIVDIDPINFKIKNSIENYDDLLKYFKHHILIDDLIENTIEYKYIYNHSIATNLINDYYHKNLYLYKKFIELYQLKLNDVADDLLYKYKKIVDDEFIDDIEIINDIDELYDDIELYKNYDIELFYMNSIIINHNNKTIKNLYDINEFIINNIGSYFNLNSKEIYYDELIEFLNIIYHDEFEIVVADDNKLYKIIDDDIKLIEYDDIDDLIDFNDILDFINYNVEIDYDYYDYENYIKLNNLFYKTFKKYHIKIDEKIYDNIRNVKKINS